MFQDHISCLHTTYPVSTPHILSPHHISCLHTTYHVSTPRIQTPYTSIQVQTPKNQDFLTFSRIDRPSLGSIPRPSIAYFQGSTTSKNIDFSKIEKSDFLFPKIFKIVISTIREGWISLKVGFLKNRKNRKKGPRTLRSPFWLLGNPLLIKE